jgi:hypothetical protein
MNARDIFQLPDDPDNLKRILQHYQSILVKLAEDDRISDSTDRENILRYLRDKQLPSHPKTIEEVMKNFASSACSYHVIRERLKLHIGAIATASSIAEALAAEFSDTRFLDDFFWNPASMKILALDAASKHGLTNTMLGGKTLHPRILGVLHDGANQIGIASNNGLDAFYEAITQHVTSAESAWKMLEKFAADIREVGAPLAADFMKNIGFHRFVKPDVHFLRQLARLFSPETSFSQRDSFILGWLLASMLKMPAFELDHTLYQWGRHGEKRTKLSTRKVTSSPTSAQHGQSAQPFSKVVGSSSPSEQILEKLLKIRLWQAECKKLTLHRQEQLAKILSKYDQISLPICHFTQQHLRNPKLRNEDAYPAVCALLCGVLERCIDRLRLKQGIVLSARVLP